ncbi:ATP-binding cassette domain-containing protein [Rhodococcus erythropolis]|uniref:ATP-binding cassette domain-containing protein n=1 Tax=Rhodococcus erythropolis TaxID=1833 RepID=UPI00355C6693
MRAGRVTGLLGKNGAIKTSCLRIVLGLANATRGSVSLFGSSPSHLPDAGSRIGFCLDST